MIFSQLDQYETVWPEEKGEINRMRGFLRSHSNCYSRELLVGHVTGAALVVNPDYSQVLLTLHKKLGKWLQLGGHCDGNPQIHESALREAEEESGMKDLALVDAAPLLRTSVSDVPLFFDIDIHEIPERKTEPAHFHYDFRYLVRAANPDSIAISEESEALRWFPIEEAFKVTHEKSMHRQFEKLLSLKSRMS